MAVSFSRGESGSPAPLRARLGYLEPGIERPVSYATEPPPGVPWENAGYDHREMAIANARSATTSVDREGFQLLDAPTQVKDFLDEEAVRTTYYAEAVELALAATGAAWGHVFDHLLRRREAERGALGAEHRIRAETKRRRPTLETSSPGTWARASSWRREAERERERQGRAEDLAGTRRWDCARRSKRGVSTSR